MTLKAEGEKKGKKANKAISKKVKKEIMKLPNQLQIKIKRAIEKNPRFHKGIYEKRARINGIDIYGSSTNPEICETKFFKDLLRKLHITQEDNGEEVHETMLKSSTPFTQFAEIWFTEVFQPTVVPKTYNNEYGRYRKHILPAFEKKKLAEIHPIDCVQFFNALKKKNIERTAESIYNTLDRIFRFAVDSDILQKNPMRTVKPIKHERKNGVPLTKEEEKQLLAAIKGHKYEAVIVLALYAGLRPCEYETARIEGEFIVAQNLKQKNTKKIVLKKIPITLMLAPYIELIKTKMTDWPAYSREEYVYKYFKKVLPNHKPYDMRTTFATRCQECKVPEQVVQIFMGHSAKTLLGKVYTKFDDSFLSQEGQKIKY